MRAARPNTGLNVALEMINGRILETDVADLDATGFAHFKMILETNFTADTIALVRGGWLPSALAATRANAMVLLDRNIVTKIVSRFDNGRAKRRTADFIDLYEGLPVRLNPILYALEGNTRSVPPRDLVALNSLRPSKRCVKRCLTRPLWSDGTP